MPRTIFHLDLDAFFCCVEELRNPALKGRAFAVAGAADSRGVVSSASYPARKFGVRNAMPTSQAQRLCPGLIIVPHSHGVYGEYSTRVMTILRDYADVLQQISVDEAFIDMSGFSDDPVALAHEIKARILNEIGLPASIGIATNKLVAKMASGAAKPNGVKRILPGDEAAFFAPMPVGELWGVGKQSAPRLEAIGIKTIGDLQRVDPARLRRLYPNGAEDVIRRAHGIDESSVHADRDVKSISEETTFVRDTSDPAMLRKVLLAQSDAVAARVRRAGVFARTVQLKLRWQDFTTVTRQTTLREPTQLGDDIFKAAELLWKATWKRGELVRLIGVGVSGLGEPSQQSLFEDDAREDKLKLAKTLDQLKSQYGKDVIKRASLQRKDRGKPDKS
jgi:DNA polymerase IV